MPSGLSRKETSVYMKLSLAVVAGLALILIPLAVAGCSHSSGASPSGATAKLTILVTGTCLANLEPCG